MKTLTYRRTLTSLFALTLMVGLTIQGCGKLDTSDDSSTDNEEVAQQIGETMAAVDESGGSSGSLAAMDTGAGKTFARLSPSDLKQNALMQLLVPSAYASSCGLAATFGSCSGTTLTRTFGGCSIGLATFDGTVTLEWGGGATGCAITAVDQTITRSPNFTVTGLRGATLAVSKTGTVGQKLTYTGGTGLSHKFTFSNDGIRRAFTTAAGVKMFDFTTSTTSAITVEGKFRATRTMSGGAIRTTNNLTGVTCDFAPTNVMWSATCNCATDGKWTGTCSDGKSAEVTLGGGCGKASVTVGDSEAQSVTFDRCYAF